MPDFMRFAVPKHRLVLGYMLLWPLIVGYKLKWVSGILVRRAIVWMGFRGMAETTFEQLGQRFATEVIPLALRPEMLAKIAWHRAQGHRLVVVSGALDVYLKHWCAAHGLELVCSALEVREGRLTGRYLGEQCVRVEKVRRLGQIVALDEYGPIHAYGDTDEDLDLLALADIAFMRGVPFESTKKPVHTM
ncbi:MAG: HAD-IB family phosphatase [Ahniella sp.]|nr:HAD-IB family phosphatase [Ahniella sp.]